MSKKLKEEQVDNGISSKSILGDFLKSNKEDHYNFEETVNYKVSTGSLNMDVHTSGGLGPGLHRFVGFTEGGKTSASLEVMKNFLNTVPNSKGFYIKAEGRLSSDMQARSGVKFVFKPEEWDVGTCFVFESNIYETVSSAMFKLVLDNEEKNRYMFIVDSVDGLIAKNDLNKTFEESMKVAGGAVIAGNLMKKISIPLTKRGHMAIFISQVRSDIKLDPYTSAPIRQTSATGGNALLHFANFIFEFEPRFEGDLILKDPAIKKPDVVKNPIVGHMCKICVKKSPNETSKNRVSYPIKYGRSNGTSIWVEREIVELLLRWGMVTRAGAWYTVSSELENIAKETGTEIPDKFQGENAINDFIESNPKLAKALYDDFVKTIAMETRK